MEDSRMWNGNDVECKYGDAFFTNFKFRFLCFFISFHIISMVETKGNVYFYSFHFDIKNEKITKIVSIFGCF